MVNWFKVKLQYILPKHALSRLVGALAAGEHGKFTTTIIKAFIKQFNVDMSEAKHEAPEYYPSFNAFFTRELKDGLRPFSDDTNELGHAVDGRVSQLGPIKGDTIFQAKGHHYSLTALLG
ncbi:MAG: phosphatidylserine decarboxylase, partial [Glaciecola sp.]